MTEQMARVGGQRGARHRADLQLVPGLILACFGYYCVFKPLGLKVRNWK